jgi:hypothetical protein
MVPMAAEIKTFKYELTSKFHNMLGICSNQRSMVLKHPTGGLYAWKVDEYGKR